MYSPVAPEKLLDTLKEKETSLLQVLPYFKELYGKKGLLQEAHVYKGFEGFKNYIRDIIRIEEDVRMIGGLAWKDERTCKLLASAAEDLEKKKKKMRVVFDSRVKGAASEASWRSMGLEYKFFPAHYSAPSSVDVFGDYVCAYTLDPDAGCTKDTLLFIIRNEHLAQSVATWWQCVFDILP